MVKGFWARRMALFTIIIIAFYMAVFYSVYFCGYFFNSCWAYESFLLISFMCGKAYCAAAQVELKNRCAVETRSVLFSLAGAALAGTTGHFTYIPNGSHNLSTMWNTLLLNLIYTAAFLGVIYLSFKAPRPNLHGVWTIKASAASAILVVYVFISTIVFIVNGIAMESNSMRATVAFLLMELLNTLALLGYLLYLTSLIIPATAATEEKEVC